MGIQCVECHYNKENKCTCKESENFGNIIDSSIINQGCEQDLSQQAYDYTHMTPWEFASKYYM